MKLKCIIVDDEQGSHYVIEHYVKQMDYAEIVSTFFNAIDAFQYLRTHHVDLIFLDINMPQLDGFALLDMLQHKPMVIFTTAYSDYALKGFDYNAIDYLHKPVSIERFMVAMDKAMKWHSTQKSEAPVEHFESKSNGRKLSINVRDILFIESMGNYIVLHTQRGKHTILMTMHEVEKKLSQSMFIRIHRSYIVNASKIEGVKAGKVLISNQHLPLGRSYKKYFQEFMGATR